MSEPATTPAAGAPSAGMSGRVLGGAAWSFGGALLTHVMRIGSVALLARLVAPRDYGLIVEAQTILGFVSVLVEFGLAFALVQREQLDEEHAQAALTFSTLLSLVGTALLLLLAPVWAHLRDLPAIAGPMQVLALGLPFRAASWIPRQLMTRELKLRGITMAQLLAFLVGTGGTSVGLAALGLGAWALAFGALVGSMLECAVYWYIRPVAIRISALRGHLRQLLRYGGGLTVARFANLVALQGDYMVVAWMLGSTQLSLYSRAYVIMAIPSLLLDSIDGVVFPAMSRMQSDIARLRSALRRGLALITLLVLPVSVLTLLLAPEIVLVLLGPRWSGAVAPLQLLAPTMLFRAAYKLSSTAARATGEVRLLAWGQALYAVHVVLAAIIGAHWGIEGVALGVDSALLVQFLLMTWFGARLTKLPLIELVPIAAPAVLVSGVAALVAGLLVPQLRRAALPALLVVLIVCLAVGAALLVIARVAPRRVLGADGLWLLEQLRDRLKRPSRRGLAGSA